MIDQVSESQSKTGICGLLAMTLSSVPTSGNSALTNTELSINQVDGTILIWTAKDATVGSHTVTVSASLENYSTPASTLTFTLTIQPRLTTFAGEQTKPAFSPPLQNVTMQQCPDQPK